MLHLIKDVENAILTALAPVAAGSGGIVNTLAAYRGQFNKSGFDKSENLIVLPAVLVRYTESIYEPDGVSSFERIIRFSILHASSNPASPDARQYDIYALMDSTKKILTNNDLGLGLMPFRIERELTLDIAGSVMVYDAQYVSGFQEDPSAYFA